MKKWLILAILTMFISDLGYASPIHPVCHQVKTLDAQAPDAEYQTLYERLKNNNLTICECTRQLLQNKEKRAIEALHQAGLLSKGSYEKFKALCSTLKNMILTKKSP